MVFTETYIPGLYEVELEKREDDRGFFARLYDIEEFKKADLNIPFVNINNAFTKNALTLRGLHLQIPPKAEDRLVRCTKGRIYDVSLDLRPNSPTWGKYYGTELTEDNRKMMFIPKGFAHGYLTLEDNTEFLYFVTEFYSKENELVVRWNDPTFKIEWPDVPKFISDKDALHPDFNKDLFLNSLKELSL